MKKISLMLLATLLLFGMVGCLKKGEELPEQDIQNVANNKEESAPLVWAQVESKVVELENALLELAAENDKNLILATDEELADHVKTVTEAYELVKDGFKMGNEKVVFDLYESARRLELSGNGDMLPPLIEVGASQSRNLTVSVSLSYPRMSYGS